MTTLICPILYFSILYDSHVFVLEFSKGLEFSKSPMKTILLCFNLSNKRNIFIYLFIFIFTYCRLIPLYIFFFFSFSFAI